MNPGLTEAGAMSLTKAQLQRLRALREKKHREAAGLFVIEGEKVVGELLVGARADDLRGHVGVVGVDGVGDFAKTAHDWVTPENTKVTKKGGVVRMWVARSRATLRASAQPT